MWILNFISDTIIHLVCVIGIIGITGSYVVKFIPTVSMYEIPIRVIAALLLLAGVWFEGGLYKEKEYELKVADLKVKIAQAEAKSEIANSKIETVYVDRVKVVKDVQVVVRDRIVKVSENIDSKCEITPDSVNILNAAARNEVIK